MRSVISRERPQTDAKENHRHALAMEASIDLIEAGCEGDEAGPPRRRGVKFRYRRVKAVLSHRESWTRARPKFTAEPDRQEQSSFATHSPSNRTSADMLACPLRADIVAKVILHW